MDGLTEWSKMESMAKWNNRRLEYLIKGWRSSGVLTGCIAMHLIGVLVGMGLG